MPVFNLALNYSQRRRVIKSNPTWYYGSSVALPELSYEIWTRVTGCSLTDPQGFSGGINVDTGLFILLYKDAQTLPENGEYLRVVDPMDFKSLADDNQEYPVKISDVLFKDIPLWTVTRASDLSITRQDLYSYDPATRGWTTLIASTTMSTTPLAYISDVTADRGIGFPYRHNEVILTAEDVDSAVSMSDSIRGSIGTFADLYNSILGTNYETQGSNYYAYTDESGEIDG